MNEASRIAAARSAAARIVAARKALADYPPQPTDGQVIREALSRLVPIAVSTAFHRWRTCPERRCRRERSCMSPKMECVAAPRMKMENIEEAHEWLTKQLREELLDILLDRTLGQEPEGQ